MLQNILKGSLGKVCIGSRMGKMANWYRINSYSIFCWVILEESVDIKKKRPFPSNVLGKKKSVSRILEYYCGFGPFVCLFVFSGSSFFFYFFHSVHCTCSKSICKGIRVCDFGNICCDNENIYIWHDLCCQGFDELRTGWWCPLHLYKAENKI